jgi:DNA primase
VITCWRCSTKAPITKFIKKVQNISYSQAELVVAQYLGLEVKKNYLDKIKTLAGTQVDLSGFQTELLPVTRAYLESRGFHAQTLVAEYDLMDGGNFGPYAWRVIIPIIMSGRVVSFTSRTIQQNPEIPRYKMASDQESLVNRNNLLYNIDTVSRAAIVVEGPVDVWRMGRGCVATLGTKFSSGQIDILRRAGVQRAFVVYDSEAEVAGERLAANLRPFISHVEVIYLEGGKDPADLTDAEARYLRRDLLGY